MSNETDRDQLDLDTSSNVLQDLEQNVMPWIGMVQQLHAFIQVANSRNVPSADYREASRLLDRVIIYVDRYCGLVGQRLDQDRYRGR